MTTSRRLALLTALGAMAGALAGCTGGGGDAASGDTTRAARAGDWQPAAAPLMTRWASRVSPDSALPEYPRPQLARARWQSLNGLWQFAIVDSSAAADTTPHFASTPHADSLLGAGAGPAPAFGRELAGRILVPFAMESALSGVGRHAERATYRRTFQRPADLAPGERLLLHFGAVDWRATVYVNGTPLGTHEGGYDTFSYDVTDALRPDGDQELVVAVFDPTDHAGQPRGKQVSRPGGIWYTPVTGIWQTVWLEPVPASSIDALRLTPDVAGGVLRLTARGRGTTAGQTVEAVVVADGREVGRATGAIDTELRVPVPGAHLWSTSDPFLYRLRVTLRDGAAAVDSVESYFGMRTVGLVPDSAGRPRIALNGRAEFQVGPLDQGWWPDGLYTAPTDDALRSDLVAMKALGFNMVRKHIKVEPARWYYYADSLGLAVWQDMPSGWNDTPGSRGHFEAELRAMLDDLHNHPSIVAWVPFNEMWGQFDAARIAGLVKQLDPSRLVNDASGWQHENAGDMVDVHRYQGPQAMLGTARRTSVVGEFGGLGFKVNGHTWAGDTWGYGGLFETKEALAERYELLLKRMWHLKDTHGMSAGIYTQLTDVEVELNGFLTYDRAELKFDTARVAAVNRGLSPYVLPELADFTDSVRVTIVQGTPTEIHYTLDGSEPTISSPRYAAPFVVRQDTPVRARAMVDGRLSAATETRLDYRRVAGRAPVAVADGSLAPGVAYEYFEERTPEPAFRMDWPVRWRVEHPDTRPDDPAPVKTGTLPDISLVPADTSELFAFRYLGYLRVPRSGVYTFTALSDDGAQLWIGDQSVLGSIGQSPATTETSGQIALQAGLQPFVLSYFQAYGPRALELYVEGPGLRRQRVPASMLVRDRAATGATGGAPGQP